MRKWLERARVTAFLGAAISWGVWLIFQSRWAASMPHSADASHTHHIKLASGVVYLTRSDGFIDSACAVAAFALTFAAIAAFGVAKAIEHEWIDSKP
jgi:hypothetical protein